MLKYLAKIKDGYCVGRVPAKAILWEDITVCIAQGQ